MPLQVGVLGVIEVDEVVVDGTTSSSIERYGF
jgi:hypothetical protein